VIADFVELILIESRGMGAGQALLEFQVENLKSKTQGG
jgi:hypothetical protein